MGEHSYAAIKTLSLGPQCLESECWKLLEFMSQSDPDCDEYLILWGQHQAYLEVLHELEGVQQKRLVAERKDWTL